VRDAIAYASTGDVRYAATRKPGETNPLAPDLRSLAPTQLVPPEKTVLPPLKPGSLKPAPPKPDRPRPVTLIPQARRKTYLVAGAVVLVVVAAVLYRTVLYVPSAHRGYVALNILPWGEVAKIVSNTGHEVPLPGKTWTPCRLVLPEGSYYIHITNPMFADPLIDTVTVRNNEVQLVTKKFTGFDDTQVLSKFQ
jgi:hypothetical protein